MDIDNFKFYNDNHGHAAGNVVLTQLAGLLKTTGTMISSAYRFGGEEFVLLLPSVGRFQSSNGDFRISAAYFRP